MHKNACTLAELLANRAGFKQGFMPALKIKELTNILYFETCMVTFTAAIKQFAEQGEKTGWSYIEIPPDISRAVKTE